ncbi:hypothetical protein N7492_007129 [Penicillium capsulatum]|uniref:Uncharacterized protein n=1 Tax=Penicillium capsulatum TaxID=69766 RepID=A0A9W9HZ95_9EURO|nr:hypothetical protein N7492_007129 [Penicillium capsulatum]KAJ6116966.1 hypothetical protein N7512_006691 [Penicillium capsulatum]
MDPLLPGDKLHATGVAPTTPFHNDNIFLSSNLQKRYTTLSIPSSYGRLHTSPPPGTVAGIVLGSVGGVVLILYLTFLALNPGGLARGKSSSTIDEEVVVRSRREPSRRGDTIEVLEERDRSRSYRRRPSHERVVVEESMTGSSVTDRGNVVEVFEEESSGVSSASPRPPRRARSGVRTVDPYDYGGGSSYGGSRY